MAKYFGEFVPPEGVKAELLRGVIVMTIGSGIVHNRIVAKVQDRIPRQPWAPLQRQGIEILGEVSEPVPDLVVLAHDHLPDSGRLLPSRLITMVVEVVSEPSVHYDYVVKRPVYAAGKIPAYLVIDPIMDHCVLLTKPTGQGEEADYRRQEIVEFGDPLPLDDLGIELGTDEFGTSSGVRPHRHP
ncbi:Uma2 family endonuclease [Streptomyces sp. NPDC004100]